MEGKPMSSNCEICGKQRDLMMYCCDICFRCVCRQCLKDVGAIDVCVRCASDLAELLDIEEETW